MKIYRQKRSRQSALALVAVMVMGALLTLVLLIASKRTAALEKELKMLDDRQQTRLEKASGPVNTAHIKHGQGESH